MPKPPFYTLSRVDQAELFGAVAERLRIAQHMVEKDAWVCWTLRQLGALIP